MRLTPVSKCLDRKLMLFGFEVLDLLAVFLALSVLNLLFGQTVLKPILVWLPTLIMAGVLRWGKKGKPEKFLIHWIRFQIQPGVLSAFEEAPPLAAMPQLRKGEGRKNGFIGK